MLVLFETAAGYAVFKLLDEKKLQKTENLYVDFETPESASKIVKLKQFHKFEDTSEALAAATAAVEGKMTKGLKKMLKKLVVKEAQQELAVADAKLANLIKEKLNVQCVANTNVQELFRGIRSQMDSLISGLPQKEMSAMALGLAHSLSRYKLKFSPDKVDTMIVQAISLLDDLDKELNNYVMRAKEWYGWHFPELGKIIADYLIYAKVVQLIGDRTNAASTDLSDILPEDLEQEVKKSAEISMGTEVSEEDIRNIKFLCEQIVEISEYRTTLYDYLKNRMLAIAPNITILVGELVGARLIAHAGSLVNLAKHPASTVQILGAEKALFRALKTRHDTPKYGMIYHASLISQSNAKLKGKMSRMLAAKTALAARVDALSDYTSTDLGVEHRARLEARLTQLESDKSRRISGTGRQKAQFDKYTNRSEVRTYNPGQDSTIGRKRKIEEVDSSTTTPKTPKTSQSTTTFIDDTPILKQKKKHSLGSLAADSSFVSAGDTSSEVIPRKKKKKLKKEKSHVETATSVEGEEISEIGDVHSSKKKKKKKMSTVEDADISVASIADTSVEQTSLKKQEKLKKYQHADEVLGVVEIKEEPSEVGESPVVKKKKKKKMSVGDNVDISLVSAADTSVEQTPQKKKKKAKNVQPDDDKLSLDENKESETSSEVKVKKKKKKIKNESLNDSSLMDSS